VAVQPLAHLRYACGGPWQPSDRSPGTLTLPKALRGHHRRVKERWEHVEASDLAAGPLPYPPEGFAGIPMGTSGCWRLLQAFRSQSPGGSSTFSLAAANLDGSVQRRAGGAKPALFGICPWGMSGLGLSGRTQGRPWRRRGYGSDVSRVIWQPSYAPCGPSCKPQSLPYSCADISALAPSGCLSPARTPFFVNPPIVVIPPSSSRTISTPSSGGAS
jgi:hypothetical protein